LAGLSNLKGLALQYGYPGGVLRSLEGISPRLIELDISSAYDLASLAGIEGCTSMVKLSLRSCGFTSLQPLSGLNSLKELFVRKNWCGITSLEGFESNSLQSLTLRKCRSLTELSGVENLSALV
jgi:hypothetical protein